MKNTDNKYNPERKSRIDRELEKMQTTIAYMMRDLRDLRDHSHSLRRFALEQIFFDRDLVDRLGKSYLPAPPCLEPNPTIEKMVEEK